MPIEIYQTERERMKSNEVCFVFQTHPQTATSPDGLGVHARRHHMAANLLHTDTFLWLRC
jgi:hypothetical protein